MLFLERAFYLEHFTFIRRENLAALRCCISAPRPGKMGALRALSLSGEGSLGERSVRGMNGGEK